LKHILTLALASASATAVASPFATQVVSYAQGSNANGSYTNPAIFGSSGIADIYVSADGQDWRLAAATSLNLFPTLGYADFTETTPLMPGTVETDFTRAMDPTMTLGSLAGLSLAELIALYDGSGGGVGIDISGTGLDFARFVRIENNSASAFNIDAVAVVPAPGTVAFGVFGLALAARRRR
jgi:hypothetical protein